MTREEINQQLHRQIKPGTEYNKYFDAPSFSTTDLATGNTLEAINQMKAWTYRYQEQADKIAKVLAGGSLQETVNNIYQFLYWHFQYSIDGHNQNLQSPSYAWATRSDGMDCKSFSILASAILLRLGIKNYLRRIKQPTIAPDAYTHVYVVVPKDQKTGRLKNDYLVIDATLSNNLEVPYLKKHDVKMEPNLPIKGLAYGGSATVSAPHEAFNDFMNRLYRNGVSMETIKAVETTLNRYLDRKQDPVIRATSQGIFVGSDFIPFNTYIFLGQLGAGEEAETEQDIDLDGLYEEVSSSDFWDNFSDIFANGINFSCWGSSNNPTKSKEQCSVDLPWILQRSGMKSSLNEATINKFVKEISVYKHIRHFGAYTDGGLAECTKEGNKLGFELSQAFLDQAMVSIQKSLASVGKQLTKSASFRTSATLPAPPSGYYGSMSAPDVNLFTVSISDIPGWTGQTGEVGYQGSDTVEGGSTSGGGFNPGDFLPGGSTSGGSTSGGSTTVGETPRVDQAGSSTATIVIVGTAIAAAAYKFFKKKK